MITLADARPDDAGAVADLLGELDLFYGDTPQGEGPERAAQVRAALFGPSPAARALLAWDGEVLAGIASWSLLWPAAGLTTSLYLKEMFVAGAYRGQGIGRMMMSRLGELAGGLGCSRVEWTADEDNPGAQAFYAALGAKPLRSKIFYRAAGPAGSATVG